MILRTELRRSSALVIGVGFLVGMLALIYSLSGPWHKDPAPWDEEWTGLAQWLRSLMSFTWPLVLGAGAWQGLRDSRSRVPELFASTPKAPWRRVLPTVGAMALALTAATVVLFVVGGVQVALTASYHHLKWLPVAAVMVLALVGFALLGMGIGRLVPSLVVPPVLAAAALAAEVSANMGGVPMLLSPTFRALDISVFRSVAVPVTLMQALWFAGLGVTGYCLLVARKKIVALVPLTLVAAVAVPVLSTMEPTVADADARELVCDDNGPRVCLTRAHADDLPAVVGPAREALALLEKLPSPPTTVVELPPESTLGPLRAGTTPLFLLAPPENANEIRSMILGGIGIWSCPSDEGQQSVGYREYATQLIVTAWLLGEAEPPGHDYAGDTTQGVISPGETVRTEIRQAWQKLQALPRDEQAERVATWRESVLTCRGELAL